MNGFLWDGVQHPLKVVLLGDSSVGKTTLVNVYCGKNAKDTKPTIAPGNLSNTVRLYDGRSVNLDIWDTAGQELYMSIMRQFYRNTNVAVICYVEENEDHIEQWINRILEEAPDAKLVFVKTKSDLLSDGEMLKAISFGSGLLKKFKGIGSFVTTSKNPESIYEVFAACASVYDSFVKEEPPQTVLKESEDKGCCSS